MYNIGWAESRRALDCIFIFMAEILEGIDKYWIVPVRKLFYFHYWVFVNIRHRTSHFKPDFPTMLKSKNRFYHYLNKCTFITKQHPCFDILLFWIGSLCSALELLCNSLCVPRTKTLEIPAPELYNPE